MKNILRKTVPLALAVLVLTGCEKEELETSPYTKVPNEQVFATTDGALVALNGIYRFMWESENHDAFGQKALDITMDMVGNDVITPVRGYGWYVNDYNHSSLAAATNTSKSGYAWRYYYKSIFNANSIIANIDNVTGTDASKAYIKGNALTLRAHSYFYLINLFQHTYKGHENAPGVPVYTEPNYEEGKARGTVQQVYDQIIADLKDAETLLAGQKKIGNHPSHININVVKGLYARVALQMEDYTTAATKANEARQGYKLMSTADYQAGFSRATNSEWMWALQIPNDQATVYASFFSHMDNTAGGYAGLGSTKLITRELYEAIPADDVRKKVFQAPVADNKGAYHNYTSLKFRLPTAGSWAADYVLMRSAEMYLIEAEALARAGNEPGARTVLNELLKSRDLTPDIYIDVIASGQELIEKILLQRRIELWGEGFSLLDMKRLSRDLNRKTGEAANGEHVASLAQAITKSITDPGFLLRIPQSEIDSNEQISAADQNP